MKLFTPKAVLLKPHRSPAWFLLLHWASVHGSRQTRVTPCSPSWNGHICIEDHTSQEGALARSIEWVFQQWQPLTSSLSTLCQRSTLTAMKAKFLISSSNDNFSLCYLLPRKLGITNLLYWALWSEVRYIYVGEYFVPAKKDGANLYKAKITAVLFSVLLLW